MSTSLPAISVVLPAHDEARTIGPLIEGLFRHVPGIVEIIVVDDGSRDDTSAMSEKAGARVLRLHPNQGKGVALRRGMAEARGELVLLMDADGQDDPADVPALLAALDPEVDLVIGSRFLGTFHPGAITPLNRAGNRFLTEALNLLFRTRVTDTLAGFKIIRRSAVEKARLDARRFDIEVELLLQVVKNGGRIVEVPVNRTARVHGKSRLNSFRDGSIILRQILRQRVAR